MRGRRMRRRFGILLPLLFITGCDSVYEQFITDAQGRALILHGVAVSASAKDDPRRAPGMPTARSSWSRLRTRAGSTTSS